jgi:UDP-N-acetylmuramate dehydrogenase
MSSSGGHGDPARRDLQRVADALGPRAERDRPLGPLTTYRVGGPAAVFWEAGSEADLLAARRALFGRRIPVLVVGKGSNLLVADAGFPGLAVRLGPGLSDIGIDGHRARAGGGAGLPVLARRTVEAGLTGLEWAVGVPGSVGGAVRMNAGGHGSDTAAGLVRYRWLDLAHDAGGEDGPVRLELGYRRSSISPTEVVVWAEFALAPGPVDAGRAQLAEIVSWRRQHQPGGSNAGSVFANPPGDSAGRLVDAAGLKGFRMGTARVSEKHANFIQADDGGSADDVHRLIVHVRRTVAERFGVDLRPEVRLIGFPAVENGDDATEGGPMTGSRGPRGGRTR